MRLVLFIIALIIANHSFSSSKIWEIGGNSDYKFCSEVMNLVDDRDTILIYAAVYNDDVQVTWRRNHLLIKGIEGRPVLVAGEKIESNQTNGKGIFVVQGDNTLIENIEFTNAKVKDHNGAGIRQEGANLTVRNCLFDSNEMGILSGSIPNCTIRIEYCEFMNNGSSLNPGYQHNIYINHIDSLIFRFNYSHDASAEGHELKSRASNNFIEYNRISNINSSDSRNIDLPNGGTSVIVGNIIEQGPNSANSNIIGFGMEGLSNPGPHNLWIANNTIVNYMNRGNFISVNGIDTLFINNNICVGAKTGGFITGNSNFVDTANNFINDDIASAGFVIRALIDYHLNQSSPAINSGADLSFIVKGHSLVPVYEEFSILEYVSRYVDDTIDLGAYEFIPTTGTDQDLKSHFSIINNLSELLISIECDLNPIAFDIFDLSGRIISSGTLTKASNQIDISSFFSGIYILKVGNHTYLFIKTI